MCKHLKNQYIQKIVEICKIIRCDFDSQTGDDITEFYVVVCWNKKESSSVSEPWAPIAQRYNES